MIDSRPQVAPHPTPGTPALAGGRPGALPARGEREGPAHPRIKSGEEGEGQPATAPGERTLSVVAADGALRLDRWFKRHYPALGHGHLEKLLRTGRIRVDGKRARASDRVEPGQAIKVPILNDLSPSSQPVPMRPRPADQAMLKAILYRDASVIVLNKPPG